jgi:hypothetical protein
VHRRRAVLSYRQSPVALFNDTVSGPDRCTIDWLSNFRSRRGNISPVAQLRAKTGEDSEPKCGVPSWRPSLGTALTTRQNVYLFSGVLGSVPGHMPFVADGATAGHSFSGYFDISATHSSSNRWTLSHHHHTGWYSVYATETRPDRCCSWGGGLRLVPRPQSLPTPPMHESRVTAITASSAQPYQWRWTTLWVPGATTTTT